MNDFIQEAGIESILGATQSPSNAEIKEILAKSKELKGLTPQEAAKLLQTQDQELVQEIYTNAREVKEAIYGNRLVLFAPLYIANHCSNNCLYCGFRRENKALQRVALTMEEIARDVHAIENEGHKRVLMLCGEDTTFSGLDYILEAIKTVYATKTTRGGEIRRVNVELAPMSTEDYRRLAAADIGTYVLFQESYHQPTYKKMHPSGPKADYFWRLGAMDRAQEAGIDDVGIGALFGLYDYRYEVMGLLFHALHLEKTFGVGPHTISVPRLEPAMNAPAAIKPPHPVSDDEFKRLVAVIRLAVPYTGIILSTREKVALRNEVFKLGISQISAGSRTNPGGYHDDADGSRSAQFNLGDTRSTAEVIYDITMQGYIPSFCTACYRLGRTGADFMELAKPGLIQRYCRTNAMMTYKEYLEDYADERTKKAGEELLARLVAESAPNLQESLASRLQRVAGGERDVFV